MTKSVIIADHSFLRIAMNRLATAMKWDVGQMTMEDACEPGSGLASAEIVLIGVTAKDAEDMRFRRLVEACGDRRVVLFAESAELGGELHMLSGKVRALIVPETSEAQMQAILTLVEAGFDVMPAGLRDTFSPPDPAQQRARRLQNTLTKREYAILSEVSRGYSNKEIANRLNISTNTVDVHVSSIIHKLRVKNRIQAALMLRGGGAGDAIAAHAPGAAPQVDAVMTAS